VSDLDELVAAQADDLEWLAQVEAQYPLALASLWTAPAARWDQRRSVLAAMTAPVVSLVLGGERAGKSRGLQQLTTAMALGGDHPAVRAWLAANDLPTHLIPDGPGRVYAVALTSTASLRYHRNIFDQLLGTGKTWYNRNGKGEAWLQIDVPGHSRAGEIWFKSVDQGPDAMQGDSIRWAWIDEEPKGEQGQLVYAQLKARVMDQRGRVGISMVPMSGYTWVYDELVVKRKDSPTIVELDALDNPFLPRDRAEAHYGAMDKDEAEMRRYGRFVSRMGAVYPTWDPTGSDRYGMGHVCDPFPVPPDAPIFRAADFGLADPTVMLWAFVDDDGTIYVFREYYQPDGISYRWHAEQCAHLEGRRVVDGEWSGGEPVEAGWGDHLPDALQAFAAVGLQMGHAENGKKDVNGGVDRVRDRLRLRSDHRPRLKVFSSCVNTIREMSGYVLDPQRRDEQPRKLHDHTCDTLRYLVGGIDDYFAVGIAAGA
jgi:hypothetical protein